MSDIQHNDLLQYYKRELSYLRGQGADFAQRYPKVASRLALHGGESLDPHTERLIESVAFLSARVHRDLDQEFPDVAYALLDNLSPSLVRPLPSMSVAQFGLDPAQGKVTAGFRVPRYTMLHARIARAQSVPPQAAPSQECRFRTAWETVLWPVRVTQAGIDADAVLRLTLECDADVDFSELEIDSLRIHIQGDWTTTMPLYDALVSGVKSVGVVPEGGAAQTLPSDAWREVGYAEGEEVLPQPANAQPAYGLLQEYFAFPRKFHFFDLHHLRGRLGRGQRCELAFQLDRPSRALRHVDADNFQLGCTPIVNLFPRVSEPLVMDQRHYEYLLVPDRQREAFTEVHSIVSVVASDPDADKPVEVPCFAALGRVDGAQGAVFWATRREPCLRQNIPGTDVFLAFVDQDQGKTHSRPVQPVVYAHLLCTNRRLAEQVPVGARLVAEGPSQPTHVRCLYEPTAQRDPPLGSETLWRLVSLLTLNHQSLVDGSTGCAQLREMLLLFASDSRRDHAQIRGIAGLSARGTTAHVDTEVWRGYCRGTQVTLDFEEDAFVGGSPLMLSAVLARFFAMYTSVNSFVRLAVRRGDEVRKQWAPMTGRQVVL